MGNNLRKQPRLDDLPNEILFQILDLPNEILFQILSNLGKKNQMNVSLVNKRCYEASNYQIKDIRIRRPTNMDNLQGLQNFINRFNVESSELPFISNGLFGYISYDSVKYFEDIKQDQGLLSCHMFGLAESRLLVRDKDCDYKIEGFGLITFFEIRSQYILSLDKPCP